jgi:hypothetical protein
MPRPPILLPNLSCPSIRCQLAVWSQKVCSGKETKRALRERHKMVHSRTSYSKRHALWIILGEPFFRGILVGEDFQLGVSRHG